MRTGLIPVHPKSSIGTPLPSPHTTTLTRDDRTAARTSAALLEEIHQASGAGNTAEVIRLAARLQVVQAEATRRVPGSAFDPWAFDTTAA